MNIHKFKNIIIRIIKPKFLYFLLSLPKPVSSIYGLDRGRAIDRYYIENFLEKNSQIIKGVCLELLNDEYSSRYGGKDVINIDVLDINKNNSAATIYGDLKDLKNIKDNTYDCIILTQVLQFIDDLELAVKECHRILKNQGTLLATVPFVSRIDCQSGIEGDYWRFTEASVRYLFKKQFDENKIEINSFGNAITSAYFLVGFSQEDLLKRQLDYYDKNFPCIITIKAKKS